MVKNKYVNVNQQVNTTSAVHGAMFNPANKVGASSPKFSELLRRYPYPADYANLLKDEKEKKKKEGKQYQEPLKMFGYRVIPTIRYKHT